MPAIREYSIRRELSYGIAGDEPWVEVFYQIHPAEPRTADCPGCPAWVEILDVAGIDRSLTAVECEAFFADRAAHETIACDAFALKAANLEAARYPDIWTKPKQAVAF